MGRWDAHLGAGPPRAMAAPWHEIVLILVVNLIISFAAGCATERTAYVRALRTPAARARRCAEHSSLERRSPRRR